MDKNAKQKTTIINNKILLNFRTKIALGYTVATLFSMTGYGDHIASLTN